MRPIVVTVFGLFLNVSWAQSSINSKEKIHKDSFAQKLFFPAIISHDSMTIGLSEIKNYWYSEMLDSLQEPKLFENDTSKCFRFLWLRSKHNPISIRIQAYQKQTKVFIKVCSGAGGYKPGKLYVDTSFNVDTKFTKYLKILKTQDYWNMETSVKSSGKDGAMWILEASTPKYYHLVERWSAKTNYRALYKCCNYLIKLSGIDVPKSQVY